MPHLTKALPFDPNKELVPLNLIGKLVLILHDQGKGGQVYLGTDKGLTPLAKGDYTLNDVGQPTSAKGYTFRKDAWSSVEVLEAKAAASGLEDLGKRLETATAAQREAAIKALDALGPEAQPRLNHAL